MDFLTADGVRIRYEIRGQGPPVLALHGGPSNICDTLVEELTPLAEHFTLVFHDYRGSGRSASAPTDTYTFDQMADDVDELRQHLGHERVPVLAHSMGGFVALRYALRHPEACARLALVGTTPTTSPRVLAGPVLRALGPARFARAVGMGIRFLVMWSWRRPSHRRTAAMYAPMDVTQEPRAELRAVVAAAHPELPADNDNATHLLRHMRGIDLRSGLAAITCPVLVLYGSRDAVMVAGGRILAKSLPHSEVHVLKDVGHEVFLEAPNDTHDVLQPFLPQTRPSE